MVALESKYGETRVHRHRWDWFQSTSKHPDEWIARYTLKKGVSVEDIWTEWTSGLDGCLSTHELVSGWDAKWRNGNKGQGTEFCRRKKLIDLIDALSRKQNWNVRLAFDFLADEYPISAKSTVSHLTSVSNFVRYLQKKDANVVQNILVASQSYVRKIR